MTRGQNVGFSGISSYEFEEERVLFGVVSGSFVVRNTVTNVNTSSGILPVTGQTYTLVGKLDYDSDEISVWVDPDLSASEGTPDASQSYSSNSESTAVRLGSGGSGTTTWENLVVAEKWEDLRVDALNIVVTTAEDEDDLGIDPTLLLGLGTSLREAVKYGANNMIITFDPSLSGQTITLRGAQLLIDRSLTIDASSLAAGITIDADQWSRVMGITPDNTVALHGLTLTGGRTEDGSDGVAGGSGGGGGAILNSGTLSLSACTLSQNSTGDGGNGEDIAGSGGSGGAIFNFGTLSLSACTLSQNSTGDGGDGGSGSGGSGGAIFNDGTLSLSACTLSLNSSGAGGTAGAGGGIFNSNGRSLSLSDTILANNSAARSPDLFSGNGSITTAGTNLLSDLAGSTLIAGTSVIVAADPLLAPLGDYGGPTQTMPPLPGSPAIDAAGTTDPGGTDQRGFPRFINDALDIGAVEILNTFNNGGQPWSLGTIQAEDFDTSTSSVSDTSNRNLGDASYRAGSPVDVQATTDTDGGFNIGFTKPGEYLEYTVEIPEDGPYDLLLRVADLEAPGGTVRIDFGGIDKTGEVELPVTGDFQTFTTVTIPGVQLEAGIQVMRFNWIVGDCNLNWIAIRRPPPEASFSVINEPGEDTTVTWNATIGETYVVEYSLDLDSWIDVAGDLVATDTSMSFTLDDLPGLGEAEVPARIFVRVGRRD